MTKVISQIYLPNNELPQSGVVTLKLNTSITHRGRLYVAAPLSFPITQSSINIDIIPNENSLPISNYYDVWINVDSLTYTTKWFIKDLPLQTFETLVPSSGTPPLLLENDPRMVLLLEDTTPQDSIPDIAERVRWNRQQVDSGLFNGVTDTFVTDKTYTVGTMVVILNGVRLELSKYVATSTTDVQILEPPVSDDEIYLEYYGI